MDNSVNTEIIKQAYRDFSEGNLQAVLAQYDKDIEWVRPGFPDIPFAGTFKGFEGLDRMFVLIRQNIRLQSFLPEKFFSNDDKVVVLGTDTVEVITTGKVYTSGWVQVFTLKDKKIIHVQVYMDTLTIAAAFQS
jgi:uncharacterized protein